MKYFVSYSNEKFNESLKKLEKSALKYGIDKSFIYNPDFILNTEFYEKNKIILDNPIGIGCWLWKPYVINYVLDKLNVGDYLLYADAGSEIISPLDDLLRICEQKDIVLFEVFGAKNYQWVKRDCFVLMDSDSERYANAEQVAACFILLKKTDFTVKIMKEWLEYCCNPNILTNIANVCGKEDYEGFKSHIYDQAVLSLLAKKYNIELFRDPSQWGNNIKLPKLREFFESVVDDKYLEGNIKINSPYKTLFNHHRGKHPEKKKIRLKRFIQICKRNYSTLKKFFEY